MVDSTVHVSNVTALVIAMEVPVQQSVHCRQYHSDSNRSRDCVDLLTANRSREARITRVNQLPRAWMTRTRGSKSPKPSHSREIINLPRTCDTNYRARDPRHGGYFVLRYTFNRLQKFMPNFQGRCR